MMLSLHFRYTEHPQNSACWLRYQQSLLPEGMMLNHLYAVSYLEALQTSRGLLLWRLEYSLFTELIFDARESKSLS